MTLISNHPDTLAIAPEIAPFFGDNQADAALQASDEELIARLYAKNKYFKIGYGAPSLL